MQVGKYYLLDKVLFNGVMHKIELENINEKSSKCSYLQAKFKYKQGSIYFFRFYIFSFCKLDSFQMLLEKLKK